jgi:hypothetical protein
MSFGFTQGSIHQANPVKSSKGADWETPATAYDTNRLNGITQNFKLPGVTLERNKILSDHVYNPYITSCPSVTPGEDWIRAPEEYETHRMKGMTNDQKYVMPKFIPNSIKKQIEFTENQHSMYHNINPLENAIKSIPAVIAHAQRTEQDATMNQAYYQGVRSGPLDADLAPGVLPDAKHKAQQRAMASQHATETARQQGIDDQRTDDRDIARQTLEGIKELGNRDTQHAPSHIPTVVDQVTEEQHEQERRAEREKRQQHQPDRGNETQDSGIATEPDTPVEFRTPMPTKKLFQQAKQQLQSDYAEVEGVQSVAKDVLTSTMKIKTTSSTVKQMKHAQTVIDETEELKQDIVNQIQELDEAMANDDQIKLKNLYEIIINSDDTVELKLLENVSSEESEEEDPFATSQEALKRHEENKLAETFLAEMSSTDEDPFAMTEEAKQRMAGTFVEPTPTEVIDESINLRSFQSKVTHGVQEKFGAEHLSPNSNQRTYILFKRVNGSFRPVDTIGMKKKDIEKYVSQATKSTMKQSELDTLSFNMTGDASQIGETEFFVMIYDKKNVDKLNLRKDKPYTVKVSPVKSQASSSRDQGSTVPVSVGQKKTGKGMGNKRVIDATRSNRY